MDGQPVLVTGAGGLLGAAATQALYAAGARVRAHLGLPGDVAARPPDGVPTEQCDIAELDIGDAVVVVHLAGPPSVPQSFVEPAHYARVHVAGTTHVAAQCAARGAHLVYVSSAEVYGNPEVNPVSETAMPRPRSPYGAAKLAAETMLRVVCPTATVLRPFSVYGPASPASSLFGRLRAQREADEITVATLEPVRDYVHVDDVAGGLVRATASRTPGVFNLGTGTGTSVRQLVALMAPGTPVRATGPDRPADVLELVADPTRATAELGWVAGIPVSEGVFSG